MRAFTHVFEKCGDFTRFGSPTNKYIYMYTYTISNNKESEREIEKLTETPRKPRVTHKREISPDEAALCQPHFA